MIIHVDMDAFYASVEIRDRPELAGKPVVVGGSAKGRGVVAAASYAARKYGIHSAMPAAQVTRLCPQAVFIKPQMEKYAIASKAIKEIFNRYTPEIEPLSLDEAFLNVSGSEKLFGPAKSIAARIKKEIQDEVGLTASAGVAPNKYLAKVASDLEKPDGLTIVEPDKVLDFLDPLEIKRIWGVGKKCEAKFAAIGIRTIGQLRKLTLKDLQPMFGINSAHFWNLSRGIDNRLVVPDRIAKSISHENTFATDIHHRDILEAWTIELMEQVGRRLRRYDTKGKTVQVKIRFSDFRTITRSQTLNDPTHTTALLLETAIQLLRNNLEAIHEPVRLLGAGVSQLTRRNAVQMQLFEQQEVDKQNSLDQTRDTIAKRFGHSAVRTGKVMEHKLDGRRPFIESKDRPGEDPNDQ